MKEIEKEKKENKEKKNKYGFTMVELLVAMAILGLLMIMSFATLRTIQTNSTNSKYDQFAKAIIEAAKLYVDSYGDDMFKKSDQSGKSVINYSDLKDKGFIKEMEINESNCNSSSVTVVKHGSEYSYCLDMTCMKGSSIVYRKADTSGKCSIVENAKIRYLYKGFFRDESVSIGADSYTVKNPTSFFSVDTNADKFIKWSGSNNKAYSPGDKINGPINNDITLTALFDDEEDVDPDPSNPIKCTITASEEPNSYGWYNKDVVLTLNITGGTAKAYGIGDTIKPVNSKTTYTATAEGKIKYYGYVKNSLGEKTCSKTINIDKNAPTIEVTPKNSYRYTLNAKATDVLSGIVSYRWEGDSFTNVSPTTTVSFVQKKGVVSNGIRTLVAIDAAGNEKKLDTKAYKEFDRLQTNADTRAYRVGETLSSECKKGADYSDDKWKNHPWKKYEFKLWSCNCTYDYYNGHFKKYNGNTCLNPTEHKTETIVLFYKNNDDGVSACKGDIPKNSYIYDICHEGNYPVGQSHIFHGYPWFVGDSTKETYHSWGKNKWYHNKGYYDDHKMASSTSVGDACKTICHYITGDHGTYNHKDAD